MVNMKIARFFRDTVADLAAPAVAQNSRAPLAFPVCGVLSLSSHAGAVGRVVRSLNEYLATPQRAKEVLVEFIFGCVNFHACAALVALHRYAARLGWETEPSRATEAAKNMVALFPTGLHLKLLAAVLAGKFRQGPERSVSIGVAPRTKTRTELLDAPPLNKYRFVAVRAFGRQHVARSAVYDPDLVALGVLALSPVRVLLDGLTASALTRLHQGNVHIGSLP